MIRLNGWHGLLMLLLVAPAAVWLIGSLPSREPHPASDLTADTLSLAITEEVHLAPALSELPTGEVMACKTSTGSQVESQWTTLESALAESRRNGKPVLIDFNAEWCNPCRRMKQEVFDHPNLGRIVRTTVIPVSIVDRRLEAGVNTAEVENLQRRYRVDVFPTLVVFSPVSDKYVCTRGYADSRQTLTWIAEAARSLR